MNMFKNVVSNLELCLFFIWICVYWVKVWVLFDNVSSVVIIFSNSKKLIIFIF